MGGHHIPLQDKGPGFIPHSPAELLFLPATLHPSFSHATLHPSFSHACNFAIPGTLCSAPNRRVRVCACACACAWAWAWAWTWAWAWARACACARCVLCVCVCVCVSLPLCAHFVNRTGNRGQNVIHLGSRSPKLRLHDTSESSEESFERAPNNFQSYAGPLYEKRRVALGVCPKKFRKPFRNPGPERTTSALHATKHSTKTHLLDRKPLENRRGRLHFIYKANQFSC